MLSFSISEEEMHMLLADYVYRQTLKKEYSNHVRNNHYDLDNIDGEWILSVDGMLEDNS